jgi:hypothetical protein
VGINTPPYLEVVLSKKIIGTIIGFAMGFLILHPSSMVLQGVIHPVVNIDLMMIKNAFNIHHIAMALFFGALGALFGFMNLHYTLNISQEKKRVSMLESLLPICAYCKKIRDDSNTPKHKGQWHEVDKYITMKTDTSFTHGMCPDCHEEVMNELDREDELDCVHVNESVAA